MIVGLIIAYSKQQRRLRLIRMNENKESLLTVKDEFKTNSIDINRSSVDP